VAEPTIETKDQVNDSKKGNKNSQDDNEEVMNRTIKVFKLTKKRIN
jgi:hypothetical protein